MIDIGGEMIAKGKNPQGWNWCIGIVRPKDDSTGTNSELEQIVQLPERLGLATSGNYRNFYLKDLPFMRTMDVDIEFLASTESIALG